MPVQLTPISSKAKLPTAINSLNTVIRQLAATSSTQVVNQGGGKALVSGKLSNGKYGEVFYDANGVARILVGQDSNGEPVVALSGDDTSILDSNGLLRIGKLANARYGELLYDSNGVPRLLIGQDSNGDPTIALSSGSNSVLTSGNERFKICNTGSNRYAQIISDANNVPRIYIGQNPSNGKPIVAISRENVNVITALGGS